MVDTRTPPPSTPKGVTKIANKLRCPSCGNEQCFFEINEDVITTTHYLQNTDGSFTLEERTEQSFGSPKLFCNECEEDMTNYHQQFSKMIF